jgi:hypothetical protein
MADQHQPEHDSGNAGTQFNAMGLQKERGTAGLPAIVFYCLMIGKHGASAKVIAGWLSQRICWLVVENNSHKDGLKSQADENRCH